MSDTNTTANRHWPSGPMALVLFMTENDDLLAAIVPVASELAARACRFHDLPVGEADEHGDFDFVGAWFFDSETKAEVCPMGALSGKDYGSIVAIYKVGC
jgi:hypothetical protein